MRIKWKSLLQEGCALVFLWFSVVTLHAQMPGQSVDIPIIAGDCQTGSQDEKGANQQHSTGCPTQAAHEPDATPAIPANTPPPNLFSFHSIKTLPGDLIRDQKAMWASPAKIRPRQLVWLAPFGAATAALLITDERANREVQGMPGLRAPSDAISRFGGAPATLGLVGGFALLGQVSHNDRARRTGFLGLEALIDSTLVGGGIKLISERSRPTQNEGEGKFLAGGSSFPSGHAISAWALATVIADEYPDKPLLRYGALAWAAAISLSRISGEHHFPSDVFVGGTLGFLIGRYVAHRHLAGHGLKHH